jgi:MFS family permease
MIPAYLGGGALADRLLRRGLAPHRIFVVFVAAYLVVQTAIALSPGPGSEMLWIAYSITGTGMVVSFSLLTPSFPAAYAGRVNTALNLMVFVAAFSMQVGIGTVISLVAAEDPSLAPLGHRLSFVGLLAVQAACFLWLLWPRPAP